MTDHGSATLLIELGAVVVGLALLARFARRVGISPIPFYLLAGLAFGQGGLLPLPASQSFVDAAGDIGAVLLLLMLGLEYSSQEFVASMRDAAPAGVVDFVLNFSPGFAAGLIFGWSIETAVFLGGITLMTSSGVMSKVLSDLGRVSNPETRIILSIAVLEDLIMAVYLPLVSTVSSDRPTSTRVLAVGVALAGVAFILIVAVRYGSALTRVASHPSQEVLLLTVLGMTLLVAGLAERVQISAAVGAFLVGIALSGDAARRAAKMLTPLRDLFAAVFFLLFGLRTDPGAIPPVLAAAAGLAAVTAATKVFTGWWAARRAGIDPAGRLRAGTTLIARGEFSIVIAGLAVASGADSRIGPLAAAYVMILAIAGPIAARYADAFARARPRPGGAETATRS